MEEINQDKDYNLKQEDYRFLYKHTQYTEELGNVVALGHALMACENIRNESKDRMYSLEELKKAWTKGIEHGLLKGESDSFDEFLKTLN